jgi:hypothetical protein
MKKKILLYLLSFCFLVILFGGSQVEAQTCSYCIWQQPDWPLGICPEPPAGRVDRGNMYCPGSICLRESCNGSDGRRYNDALCTCGSGGSGDSDFNLDQSDRGDLLSYLLVCPSSANLIIGENRQLEARYFVRSSSRPTCLSPFYSTVSSSSSWSSGRTSVATVTNSGTKGIVTGVDLGTTTITARYGGFSASSDISVVRPPLLLVCPSSTTIGIGETQNLQARYWDSAPRGTTTCDTRGYSNVTRSSDWLSSSIAIATIGNNGGFLGLFGGDKGLLTGIALGETIITASYDGLNASSEVTVPGGEIDDITVDLKANPMTVAEGGNTILTWITTGDPDSCTASGGWSGSKAVGGGFENQRVSFGAGTSQTFILTCSKVGVDPVVDSVSITKEVVIGDEALTIKRNNCSGSSTQFDLAVNEEVSLVACDESDNLVSSTWTTGNASCISLVNTNPSQNMTIKAVGDSTCSPTDITATATGYLSDSISVGITGGGGGSVPGPRPTQPPTWREVAP